MRSRMEDCPLFGGGWTRECGLGSAHYDAIGLCVPPDDRHIRKEPPGKKRLSSPLQTRRAARPRFRCLLTQVEFVAVWT